MAEVFEAGVGIAGADQDQDDGGEDEGWKARRVAPAKADSSLVLAALPRLRTARNDNGKENFISVTRSYLRWSASGHGCGYSPLGRRWAPGP